jgi:hypothetical protein
MKLIRKSSFFKNAIIEANESEYLAYKIGVLNGIRIGLLIGIFSLIFIIFIVLIICNWNIK